MNKDNKELDIIPEHHSPIRHILNEAHGIPNNTFIKDFIKAQSIPNSYVIMEGDWGGQIYLSCPMARVMCDEKTLITLLEDFDRIAWDCNDGEGSGLYYEIHHPGDIIGGGMGGGKTSDGIWLHKEFMELKLFDEVKNVLIGNKKRIII